MSSNGIKDRVAIVGMGCTPFGEHWDKGIGDLALDASQEALRVGRARDRPDRRLLARQRMGQRRRRACCSPSRSRSATSRSPDVENICATGSEAIRNAAYAVASGAYDVVMAIGVEKLKDSGYSGLFDIESDRPTAPRASITPPAAFSMIVPAYAKQYGIDEATLKDVISRIAWKNHANGAKNPKAQYRKEIPLEQIKASPNSRRLAWASWIAPASPMVLRLRFWWRADRRPPVGARARSWSKDSSFIAGPAEGDQAPGLRLHDVARSRRERARMPTPKPASTDPREQVSMAEVHDCFTPTEMVLMEDLGFSARGKAWEDVLAGRFQLDGPQPINSDGGLKSFGHPSARAACA